MKSSIVIVLFFALGILLNLYGLYPSYLEQLDLSFYALCALMFCVGITVGNNPQILLNFKTVNPRFFFASCIDYFRHSCWLLYE